MPLIGLVIALVACLGFIVYVIRANADDQMSQLSVGFIALGVVFVAMAIWCLRGMWRASSRAQGGRSFGMALIGGFAGLAAIGCFSGAALLLLVLNS